VITALVLFIALQHFGFMLLEMFLWTRPAGRKIFGLKPEFARQSAKLASNQGLYNGFLAAGLIFGLLNKNASVEIILFFLGCIIIAGIFAAFTVSRSIFFVQSLPAIIALGLLLNTY
jgi:putative membrane protein